MKNFICAAELTWGFTFLQIADHLRKHSLVALGRGCVHSRYVRRRFMRMQRFEAGFGGRGGFGDG